MNKEMTQLSQPDLRFPKVPQVSIYGIQVSKLSFQDTVNYLTGVIGQNTGDNQAPFHVVTANPIMIMTALNDSVHMTMMKNAELVVPDGTGLVWATHYVGNPVAERVPGIDLLHGLMKLSEQNQWSVFLLGTSPETIHKTADNLSKQYPRLILAGYRDGYFQPAQDEEVVAQIREASPHILLVGRSADNQDIWIDKYK
ncbi:MAG TPA: WecB/TagA/CpsF family glycosyltransferase, partial [Bacilli bacterium]